MILHVPRRSLSSLAVTGLFTALILGSAGCGGDGDGGSEDRAPAASGTEITIENFKFSPDPLSVRPGATITVKNSDGSAHTATADDNSFDTGEIEGGGEATVAVAKTGTIAYHCEIHDYMKGSVKVSG